MKMSDTLAIDNLPEEVLQVILSKLSFSERKTARLVNKTWLSLCNTAPLTKNEFLKIKFGNLHQVKVSRGCLNLEILDGVNNHDQEEFWTNYGDSLRSLVMSLTSLPYPTLNKIIEHCSYLTHLSLAFTSSCWNHNFLFDFIDFESRAASPKLECLKSLSLSGNYSFSLIRSAKFLKPESVPNLKRLELQFLSIFRDFFNNDELTIISSPSPNLNELIIKDCCFTPETIWENILIHKGPELSVLNLGNLSLDSLGFLMEQSPKLFKLKCLNLSYIRLRRDSSLNGHIRFENVEFVSVFRTNIQNTDLMALAELEHLKGLDIRRTDCTAGGIAKCFASKMFPNVIALRMSGVTDTVLTAILHNLTNLKFLDLSFCEISMIGLQAIIFNCNQLTHLELEETRKIGFKIKPLSINNLTNLVHLNANFCVNWVPCNIAQLRFNKLKTIGLKGVSFSEDEMKEIMKNCPRLTRVVAFDRTVANWNVATPGFFGTDFHHQVTIFDFATNKM